MAFLVPLPVLWAAIRGDQLTSALAALVIASCAVWGGLAGTSLFGPSVEAFWPLATLLVAVALLALLLSAHMAVAMGEQGRLQAHLDERSAQLLRAERLANVGTFVWTIAPGRVAWSERLLAIHGLPPADAESSFDDWIARVHENDRTRVKESAVELTPEQETLAA